MSYITKIVWKDFSSNHIACLENIPNKIPPMDAPQTHYHCNKIEEHIPESYYDHHYFVVYLGDGSFIKVFNPEVVEYA